jgi:chromosome segregation ATPase
MIKTKEEKIEILKNEILELNDDLTKLTEDLDEAMKFKKDFDEMDLIEKLTYAQKIKMPKAPPMT